MPLKAVLDSTALTSIFMSDEDWREIRTLQRSPRSRDSLRMPCCGARAIGKTSTLGLRFFAHAPGGDRECKTANESAQHLALKAIIASACREAGWEVDVEVRGDGWVADVLAAQGERRIAFEVQWSHQTGEDYDFRTSRYRESSVESVWLRRVTPRRYHAPAGPNVFDMEATQTAGADSVRVNVRAPLHWGHTVTVRDFTAALLDGTLKRVGPEVLAWKGPCWKCRSWMTLWWVEGETHFPPAKGRVLARRALRETPELRRMGAPLAKVETKWSQAAGKAYDGLCCPECGALQGDSYLSGEALYVMPLKPMYLAGQDDGQWIWTAPIIEDVEPEADDPVEVRVVNTAEMTVKVNREAESATRPGPAPKLVQAWSKACVGCREQMTVWAADGELMARIEKPILRAAAAAIDPIDGHPLASVEKRRLHWAGADVDLVCCPSCGKGDDSVTYSHAANERLVVLVRLQTGDQ